MEELDDVVADSILCLKALLEEGGSHGMISFVSHSTMHVRRRCTHSPEPFDGTGPTHLRPGDELSFVEGALLDGKTEGEAEVELLAGLLLALVHRRQEVANALCDVVKQLRGFARLQGVRDFELLLSQCELGVSEQRHLADSQVRATELLGEGEGG